jgi:hypothetical protein
MNFSLEHEYEFFHRRGSSYLRPVISHGLARVTISGSYEGKTKKDFSAEFTLSEIDGFEMTTDSKALDAMGGAHGLIDE